MKTETSKSQGIVYNNWENNNRAYIDFYSIEIWIWIIRKYLKVRGPFVQTLCIEKDSYMDAI